MTLCGFEIALGEKRQVKLPVPGGEPLEAWLLCGAHSGKTMVVTAGVHGCEYVGILALQKLAEMLRERSAKKIYHCIVKGQIKEASHLEGFLVKDASTNQVRVAETPQPDAKPIATAYKPLVIGRDATLLEVHLITGRRHQIRAHLASIGHPIAGDPKYGDPTWNQVLRQKYHKTSQ